MSIPLSEKFHTSQDHSAQLNGHLIDNRTVSLTINTCLHLYIKLDEKCIKIIENGMKSRLSRIVSTCLPKNDNCNALPTPNCEIDPLLKDITSIPNLIKQIHSALDAQYRSIGNRLEDKKFALLLTERVVGTFSNV